MTLFLNDANNQTRVLGIAVESECGETSVFRGSIGGELRFVEAPTTIEVWDLIDRFVHAYEGGEPC